MTDQAQAPTPDSSRASEEKRPTKRETLNSDRVTIIVSLDQPNTDSPTYVDIDIAVLDNETNEEVSGSHIHVEREGLVPALNAVGKYLQIVATRMAYAVVDQATKDEALAKQIGLGASDGEPA